MCSYSLVSSSTDQRLYKDHSWSLYLTFCLSQSWALGILFWLNCLHNHHRTYLPQFSVSYFSLPLASSRCSSSWIWQRRQLNWKKMNNTEHGSMKMILIYGVLQSHRKLYSFVCLYMSRITIKQTTWLVRPAKAQISLGIRPVWSESSLSAWRKIGSWATHWVHSEDSDQTGRMPRLICILAGRTVILLFCRVAAHIKYVRGSFIKSRNRTYTSAYNNLRKDRTERIGIFCKWATSWQNQQCDCAPSEDSDQPGHDKTNKVTVRPAKTQISLGIRPV